MKKAKTIKLLLSNGDMTGLIMAELSKWDGIMFSSPRESYSNLSKEPESKYWGVYLLVSDEKVYIGQANDLLRRIGEHDKTKDWWNKVILLSTKDNSFNRSDIDYLESKMINVAKKLGTLEMDNFKRGNTQKVSRYRETELEDYLDGAFLLLELTGIRVFTSKGAQKTKRKSTPKKLNESKPKIVKPNTSESKTNKMTKKKAIELVRNKINITNSNITFASLQKKINRFWANPNKNSLDSDWYIILNNQETREIVILLIKKNQLNVDLNNSNSLAIRKDRPQYIDLSINAETFYDHKSRMSLSDFVVERIRY